MSTKSRATALTAAIVIGVLGAAGPAAAATKSSLALFPPTTAKIARVQPRFAANQDTTVPVLFVHGYINTLGGCAGEDVSKTDAQLGRMLTAQGWTGPLVGLSYYCGDKGGPSIDNAGTGHCDRWSTAGYGSGTAIERLACDFAWWTYDTYTVDGQAVDVVAHSMGGLISRYALSSVAAGDAAFPPSLLVNDVVTISTPYAGWDRPTGGLTSQQYVKVNCGSYTQCQEMTGCWMSSGSCVQTGGTWTASAFLTTLAALPAPSADWTTEGGGPADNVDSFRSSSSVTPAHKVNYYGTSPVKYNHTSYLTDISTDSDEPYDLTQPDGALVPGPGAHSLLMAVNALLSRSV